MKKEIRDYLEDILNECIFLSNKTLNLNFNKFNKNETLKKAFVRSLEIIGEAARKIPPNIKKEFSEIDWQKVVSMRNILIHEYFGVDYNIVWKTIIKDIPKLKSKMEKLLKKFSANKEKKK